MPLDTLEWRAAEYEIDPGDTDLLMDVVIYESVISQEGPIHPLYLADSISQARDNHLGKIMQVKSQLRPAPNVWKNNKQRKERLSLAGVDPIWSKAVTEDALVNIRTGHLMDPEVVLEKNKLVKESRDRIRRSIDRPNKVSRVDQIREMRRRDREQKSY